MKELSSCKLAMESCITQKYFAVAHLYKEEKVMKMHIHDCYEIYYSISGGKQFLIDNKLYAIEPGDLFVINQYESHYLTQIIQEVHERIVLSVHPEFVKQLSTEETDLSYCFTHREEDFCHKLSLSRDQQQRFMYYIHKIISANDYGHDLLEHTAFTELMLLLNQAYHTKMEAPSLANASPVSLSSRYHTQVDAILAFINAGIHETISLESLSAHFFMSESYLCRIFKATTGMTINKYITARRISIAKALLASGLSVNEVCEQCGYNDYSNFVKTFSKAVGMSPKKYAGYSNAIV